VCSSDLWKGSFGRKTEEVLSTLRVNAERQMLISETELGEMFALLSKAE